jgi:hypothetical protein
VRQVHRWSKWPGSTALSDEADSRPMKGSQDLDGFHNVTRSGVTCVTAAPLWGSKVKDQVETLLVPDPEYTW